MDDEYMTVRRSFYRLAAVFGVLASVATGTNAQDYTLAPGDTVEVSVFARPDLSRNYRVRVDGTISLHLVGPIVAKNLSPSQLEAEIETRLSEKVNEIELADGPVVLDAVVELVGEEAAQTLAQLEYNFRKAQLEMRELAISSQDVQVSLAAREAQAFEDRRIIVGDQLEMTLAQVEKEGELVKRGLKRAEELFLLRSTASQLRADALEALGLESEARQNLERALASQDVEDVERQDAIANRLTNLESEILATKVQLEESRAFVVKFGGVSALDATEESLQQYEIIRTVDGEVVQMMAELETKLFPGDLLSVTVLTGR